MLVNMYSVFDEKAQAFRSMHFVQSDGVAIRNFSDAVCNENPNTNYLRQHPQDYSLYCLAVFDDETGRIEPIAPIRLVCRASEFLNRSAAPVGGVETKFLQGEK